MWRSLVAGYRHLPVLSRCLGPSDVALLVAPYVHSERPRRWLAHRGLLVLTRDRLVATSESPLFRRLRLHLCIGRRQLAEVAWTPCPDRGGIQFAATAVDGVREHFWILLAGSEQVASADAALRDVFGPVAGVRLAT